MIDKQDLATLARTDHWGRSERARYRRLLKNWDRVFQFHAACVHFDVFIHIPYEVKMRACHDI